MKEGHLCRLRRQCTVSWMMAVFATPCPCGVGYTHGSNATTPPPHLPWDLVCTNSTGRFSFPDLYVISLAPLHHHTYFKETHNCAYVPWNSNVPRSTKTTWITGECIRHLRRCSHRPYYQAVLRRLQLCLVRLRYPKHLWERFPIT